MNDRLKFKYVIDEQLYEVVSVEFEDGYVTVRMSEYELRTVALDYKKLIQCTGLKDKNGKLIYEGDILKLAEFGKPVEVKHRALGFVLRREPSNTVGYDNDKYIPEDCEVIGNIYENKELLNEIHNN